MAEKTEPMTDSKGKVSEVLQNFMVELDAELKSICDERDREIKAAREKYVKSLKDINARRAALKRVIKTTHDKL